MSSVTLGANVQSLKAQRQLAVTERTVTSTFERLSSGQRINRASDDAAGLAISSSLRSSARVFNQGLRNVNDGQSLLSIAQSSLGELTNISTRLRELSEQAANGTYSLTQRRAMNDEATALVNEHNRIVQSVDFNGLHLLDKSLDSLRIQAGYGLNGSVSFGLGDQFSRNVASGTYQAAVSVVFGNETAFDAFAFGAIDLNRDGKVDLVGSSFGGGTGSGLLISLGNGNGTFKAIVTYATGTGPIAQAYSDFNGDGIVDIVVTNSTDQTSQVNLGNGDGTFKAALTINNGFDIGGISSGDLNGDGVKDLVFLNDSGSLQVYRGNGNGTFQFIGGNNGASPNAADLTLADFNGDEILDAYISDYGSTTASIFFGNGNGSFGGPTTLNVSTAPNGSVGDVNRDGALDIVTVGGSLGDVTVILGNGNGTFKAASSFSITTTGNNSCSLLDIDGDGILDLLTTEPFNNKIIAMIGNGNGTFKAPTSYLSGTTCFTAFGTDINGDGATDLVSGDLDGTSLSFLLADPRKVTTLAYLNLATRQGALEAMSTIDGTLQRIASELGGIGSTQSRLQVAANNLNTARENYLTAESRITDADMASESATLVKSQILQQAASSVLAQANQQPALALSLIS